MSYNSKIGKQYYPGCPNFKIQVCLIEVNGGNLCKPVAAEFGCLEKCELCGVKS